MNGNSTTNRLVLVEGNSDLQVVKTLRQNTKNRDQFWIEPTGGINQLLKNVPNNLQDPRFTRNSPMPALGYVVDADDDRLAIWKELKMRCQDESIPEQYRVYLPDGPDQEGTIVMRSRPRLKVGVWVMPDNVNSGELEDFLAQMVPNGNADWPRARSYVQCSERDFGDKVKRAEVLAWIATRKSPGRFDEAIKNRDLKTDGELCQSFVAWLNRLFGPEEGVADIA